MASDPDVRSDCPDAETGLDGRLSVPIKSYLAHAVAGQRDELARALAGLAGCAIVPATNRDVVVLVTDTPDDTAEEELQEQLAHLPGLQCLTLVAGLADPESEAARAEERR